MKGRNGDNNNYGGEYTHNTIATVIPNTLLKIFIVCDYELIFIAHLFPQLLLKQSYLPVLGLH